MPSGRCTCAPQWRNLAIETKDESLAQACERLWNSATGKRMYVTGGIGSSARQEAVTFDFDLPNDTAYAETCAAIGLFIFSHRMAQLRNDSRYADIMERTLYNGILSGLALDGHGYFYVNPLEVLPEACDENLTLHHVKYRRQPWYGCACCPPNIARILASLGEYVYHLSGDTLYADLFHTGRVSCTVGGNEVSFRQTTEYPRGETVSFEFTAPRAVKLAFAVRIPSWCAAPSIKLNGESVSVTSSAKNGYVHFRREWKPGDRLELVLPMKVERVHADPRVRHDWGKVALQRGPFVYCLEQADNGENLNTVTLSPQEPLSGTFRKDLLGGVYVIEGSGTGWRGDGTTEGLYSLGGAPAPVGARKLTFIPYYAWANREPGEMTVWVRE